MTPPLPLLERIDSREYHGRIAIGRQPTRGTEPPTTFSYATLMAAAREVASQMETAVGGNCRGVTLAFLQSPGFDYVATLLGVWLLGGVALPLHTAQTVPEVQFLLADSQARIFLVHPQYVGMARQQKCKHIVWQSLQQSNSKSQPTLTSANSHTTRESALDQAAMLIYTSGSTGKPKGVVWSHRMLTTQCEILTRAWGWTRDDHILHVLPLHHVHGVINVLLCALYAGARCTFFAGGKASTEDIGRALMDTRAGYTLFMAVPTIYSRLLTFVGHLSSEEKVAFRAACQHMRLMVSGSAALPRPVLDAWQQASGHLLLERYGMSESGMSLSQSLDLAERKKQIGTVGLPLPTVQTRIVPLEGDAAAAAIASSSASPSSGTVVGELRVKGPSIFRAYWNLPEKTAAEFDAEGWFKTGDVVERTAEGYYRILGRSSVDVLKSAGYKISALDVERELLGHPDVAEVAVVGVPSEEYGQIVAAIVALKSSGAKTTTPDALQQWSRTRLASYQVPRQWLLVDAIPRNAMGKTNKKELVKLFDTNDKAPTSKKQPPIQSKL